MNFHIKSRLFFNDRFPCRLLVLFSFLACCLPILAQEVVPEVGELKIGEKIERDVASTIEVRYPIQLKRGQVLRVNITEMGADAATGVFLDSQKVSAVGNAGSGFDRESITLIADRDGLYLLVVLAQRTVDPGKPAKYGLTASLNDSATPNDRQRVQAEAMLESLAPVFSGNDKQISPAVLAKCEELIKIWQGLGDKYWEAKTKLGVGGVLFLSGNPIKAESYLNDALKIFDAGANEADAGLTLLNLGAVYLLMKKEEQARESFVRGVEIARKLGDKRLENMIGLLGLSDLVPNTADRSYEKEIAAAREKKDKGAEAAIWSRAIFGYLLDDEADAAEKLAFFDKAEREVLPLLDQISDRDIEMKILVGLGMGVPEAAEETTRDKEKIRSANQRAKIYLGRALLLSGVHVNRFLEAAAYMGLYTIYIYNNTSDVNYDRLAIYFGKKVVESAQKLKLDLKASDKETQQDVSRKLAEGYDEIIDDLFSEGRLPEALQLINLGRDQEFFDLKLQPEQITPVSRTPREIEGDRIFDETLRKIAPGYVNRPIGDYPSAAGELEKVFSKMEQEFSGKITDEDVLRDVPDLSDIQFALNKLLEKTGRKHAVIYTIPETEDLLLITAEKIKAFRREMVAPLKVNSVKLNEERSDERILDFLKALRSPDCDPRPLASMVYQRIFKTVEVVDKKQSSTTFEMELERYKPEVLLWSLSGNMRYIPVAALYDAEKKQYLVEKYQNVVFTRARKERFLIEPKPWTRGLAFGTSVTQTIDLAGKRMNFPALPAVKTELSTIFGDAATKKPALFPGTVFLNRVFNRKELLATPKTNPAFVHIASHFVFQPGDAKNSFLLLGNGEAFTLSEMQQAVNLFNGVDLVTLSACETAAQQADASGREIDGFAELAQRVGASSILATLWKVSDNGTAKLMTEFYRRRKNYPEMTKAETLRQAQLGLLNGSGTPEEGAKRRRARGVEMFSPASGPCGTPFKPAPESPFEHPYYWAPFVLFGSSR